MIVVKEAIEREDYERAAQLRDEIRKFEQRQ
ncbi:MAG: UvrB/UvrC motif-containing protein [Ignavibacteria bacterium]|nr:UvrB/UvrC motif-containing protein [Ignavibacteria bacterium]MBI3765883.1 UvrB/UvrC motif-containing protein [Ignavibacteriales bacterium]